MDDIHTQKSPSKKKSKKNKKRKQQDKDEEDFDIKKSKANVKNELNLTVLKEPEETSDEEYEEGSTEEFSTPIEDKPLSVVLKSSENGSYHWNKENDLQLLNSILLYCKQKQNAAPKETIYPRNIDFSVVQESFKDLPAEEIQKRWQYLTSKVRKQRTLEEVTEDAVKHAQGTTQTGIKSSKSSRRLKQEMGCPKKPLSSYLLFCQERRSTIVKENPNFTPVDATIALGAEWKAMTQEQHNKYKQIADDNMLKYKEVLIAWEKEHVNDNFESGYAVATSARSAMKHTLKGLPVNALEFYFIKQNEERKNENLNIQVITEEWLNLSAKDESRWLDDFAQQLELKGFIDLASTVRSKLSQPKSKASREAWKKFQEDSGATPPVTVYGMFQEKVSDDVDQSLTSQEKSKEIKALWIAMKDSKKERLVKKFNKRLNKYKESLFEYAVTLPVTVACEVVMIPQVMRILLRNDS